VTRHADLIFVVLAWIFVIFRYLQAYVHVTSNRMRACDTASNNAGLVQIFLVLPHF
jgi:hypothetical protein